MVTVKVDKILTLNVDVSSKTGTIENFTYLSALKINAYGITVAHYLSQHGICGMQKI